ncbi:HNH endonuclease [Paenibacillus aurantiacus]|uniref:HNH endonuclease n=1 Tax=Paenibacillus aurantiacus TaxID=1936118 RepID=A0ABV5KTA9_9BACL
MWQITLDNYAKKITRGFDNFVDDFFNWVLDRKPTESLTELFERAKNIEGRLGEVSRATSVSKWLVRFANCAESEKISYYYYYKIKNYHLFTDTGVPVWRFLGSTKSMISKCFHYFYSTLIDTVAFQDAYINDYEGGAELKKQFRTYVGEKHPICPYCDHTRIDLDRFSSIDHFFPKAIHPLLSIHSNNLVLACSACNDRIKQAQVLIPALHPYIHEPHDYFQFYFSSNYQVIFARPKLPSHLDITKKYMISYQIEALYQKRLDILVKELSELRGNVRRAFRRYRNLSVKRWNCSSDEEVVKRMLEYHIKYRINKNYKLKGQKPMVKMIIDFYTDIQNRFLESESRFIVINVVGY